MNSIFFFQAEVVKNPNKWFTGAWGNKEDLGAKFATKTLNSKVASKAFEDFRKQAEHRSKNQINWNQLETKEPVVVEKEKPKPLSTTAAFSPP